MEKKASEAPACDRVCKNCRWRSDDFTSVCVNDASDHLADFVMPDDGCEVWEGKDDQ